MQPSQLPARVTLFENGFAAAAPDDVVKFVDLPEAVMPAPVASPAEKQKENIPGSLSCTQIFNLGAL